MSRRQPVLGITKCPECRRPLDGEDDPPLETSALAHGSGAGPHEVVEAAARAAYEASQRFNRDGVRAEEWELLPEYWRRIFRAQATAALAVIVPAVTEQIRALHESHHWCISDEGTPDMFSPDKSLGFPWPCRERHLLDELDAAARGEQS